jgi:CrcB protein
MSLTFLWHSLLVGAGGFVGSVLRFGVGSVTYRLLPEAALPYGTLAVNGIGCFWIGLLGGLGDARGSFGPEFRLLFFLGLLGGFTTFSAFGYETLTLFREAAPHQGILNVALHLGAGLVAVWLGYSLGRT